MEVTRHHFVQEDTKGPPIDRFRVSLTLKQFRGDVLRGTTES